MCIWNRIGKARGTSCRRRGGGSEEMDEMDARPERLEFESTRQDVHFNKLKLTVL
jgi:hypothetical protein